MTDSFIARSLRDKLLADPFRPGWHFASPGDNCSPGDPNGAFYADGRYHLMILYYEDDTDSYRWGHISSADLLHWRRHPDALTAENGDRGCFSGGAFVDDDGTAWLSFWKFPARTESGDAGGIDFAWAKPPYDVWTRLRPLAIEGNREPWGTMDRVVDGKTIHLGCSDPSNVWKKDGFYYIELGCLPVLSAWGRQKDSPAEYRGDWTELFRSRDMRGWEYVGRFYRNPHTDTDWPDETEDDMCPSLLPLGDREGKPSGKYLQLFISHNKGAQYYVGRLEGETFVPESHGRMSRVDNTCFAPEALVDGTGRQLAWFWLLDDPETPMETFGWRGVYSFPRELWLENGVLCQAPARELDRICFDRKNVPLPDSDVDLALPAADPLSLRLKARLRRGTSGKAGFVLGENADGSERCRVWVDFERSTLCMETLPGRAALEEMPLEIRNDVVSLELLLDRSVVEVYADERQAIVRRYFGDPSSRCLTAMGGGRYEDVTLWRVEDTNTV